ncbi:MAG: hypothetical protein R2867_31880 [Caldilineaceae bacterium]
MTGGHFPKGYGVNAVGSGNQLIIGTNCNILKAFTLFKQDLGRLYAEPM